MTVGYLSWNTTAVENAGGSSWAVSTDGNTATISTGGQVWGATNNPLQNSGSYYCEITIQQYSGSGNVAPGIIYPVFEASPDVVYGVYVINNGQIYYASSSSGGYQNSGYSLGASLAAGDVICIATSVPNLVWLSLNGGLWNGNSSANPATGVGGISLANIAGTGMPVCPGVGAPDGINGQNAILIINSGQEAFQYTPPALFNAWPGPAQIVLNSIPNGSAGNPLSLSGVTYNSTIETLTYKTSNGLEWTVCPEYSGGQTWTAEGPTYPNYAVDTLQVSDYANPLNVSNSESFYVQGQGGTGIEYGFRPANWTGTSDTGTNSYGTDPVVGSFQIGNCADYSNPADGWAFAEALNSPAVIANTTITALTNSFSLFMDLNIGNTLTYANVCVGAGPVNLDGIGCYQLLVNVDPIGSGTSTGKTNTVLTGPGAPSGGASLVTPAGGAYEWQFFQDADTGDITLNLLCNGVSLALLGPANASGFGNFSVEGIAVGFSVPSTSGETRAGSQSPELTLGNLVAYDTAIPPETLSITSAVGSINLVALEGSNIGNIATGLDSRLDNAVDYAGNPVWNEVSNFTSGSAWNATVPVLEAGAHVIQVRDSTETSAGTYVTSNIASFTIPLGIFVWNGVKLT